MRREHAGNDSEINQKVLYNMFQAIVSNWWNELLIFNNASYDPQVCHSAPHKGPNLTMDQIVIDRQTHTSDLWQTYKNVRTFQCALQDMYSRYVLLGPKKSKERIVLLSSFHQSFQCFMLREDQNIVLFSNRLAIKCSKGRAYTPVLETDKVRNIKIGYIYIAMIKSLFLR